MGYFELKAPVAVKSYPFDFHSHFNGILPLESELKWTRDTLKITIDGEKIEIKKEEELSILGLLGKKAAANAGEAQLAENAQSTKDAHYKAFQMVLKHIEKENPLRTFDVNVYQRGECAAENIYIACCLLQYISGNRTEYDFREPDIYQITGRLLENGSLKSEAAYHIIAYFNKKLFAANKYTPFDDAYWVRGAIGAEYTNRFNLMSLCYMYESGVRCAQIALSKKSVERINTLIENFEAMYQSSYKLLVQSPNVYSDSESFVKELDGILELFLKKGDGSPKHKNLVGIDLLAPEVKTGLYKNLFEFLENKRKIFRTYTENNHPSRKAIIHIHCGEGGGNSENNRSLCGFYLCNAFRPDIWEFSSALAGYAIKCYQKNAARKKERERERGNLGEGIREYSEVTTLFDELFQWNHLVMDGLQLHRFDINSPISRALVAYNGKINIIHLCDVLDKGREISTANVRTYKKHYYWLTDNESPFSLRIGHAYYDRNYLCAKFPALYYDTNLGSNFITGASGVFDSTQMYRINRGLRHLDGHIDTNLIEDILNSVAYMGEDRFNAEQMKFVRECMNSTLRVDTINKMNANSGSIPNGMIGVVKEFLINQFSTHGFDSLPQEIKFKVACAIVSIALNCRSYILGADGQGVEHSDTEAEFVRMVFMLAYGIGDGVTETGIDYLNNLGNLVLGVSKAYWEETIGACLPLENRSIYKVERFQGFKSRNSVVLVKASRTPVQS